MIVGGYTLHVYCAKCNAFAENNNNVESKREAIKELRDRGWLFAGGEVWCPLHKADAITVRKVR